MFCWNLLTWKVSTHNRDALSSGSNTLKAWRMRTAVLNPQHLRHPPPPPSSRVSRIRSATAERRRVAINLLQSVDLTEMGKEGKLEEMKVSICCLLANLMRLYYFQKFEERFRTSFQLLCRWLLLPENGIMVSWGWTGWDLPSPQQK